MRLGRWRGTKTLQPKARDRGSSECYILDPLLLPRLEQFSYNHSLSDLDACVDYLRHHYKEYGRKQQGPFRRLVCKAIQVLQKRLRDAQRAGGSPRENPQEFKLRRQEEERSRRFSQDEQLGSTAEEDVTSSGSDDSRDESEAARCRSGSDTDEKNNDLTKESVLSSEGFSEEKEGIRGERRTRTKRMRLRARMRKHAEEAGFDTDSEGEDEVLGLSPAFNLLNSSLRSTYHGRPALLLEKSDVDVPSVVQSPRPGVVTIREPISKIAGEEEREPQKHSKIATPAVGAKQTQAFASPSAVAAAARAASSAGRKRLKQTAGTASSENRPFLQQDGKQELAAEENHSLKHQASLEGTEGANLPKKAEHKFQTGENGKQKTGASKWVDAGIVSREINRGQNLRRRKRRGGFENQDKVNAAAVGKPDAPTAEPVRFSDLGGIDDVLSILREVTFPLYNPEVYPWLGLEPLRGILLHGPPGCGKTKLAHAIAHETGLPFLKISAPEVVSGMSGESEAKVRGLFAEAARLAPCIVFIDEIDAITSKRENAQREMERRIVTQLMTCMDELSQSFQRSSTQNQEMMKSKGHVLVIGATNRPEALDPALRRPGRFEREIMLGIPDENGRAAILSVLAKHLRLEGSFDFKQIARCTPGFVGADLAALTREAGTIAVRRIIANRHSNFGLPSIARFGMATSPFDETTVEYQSPYNDKGDSNCSKKSSMENICFGTSAGAGGIDSPIQNVNDTNVDSWWKASWTHEEILGLSITMKDFEEAVAMVQPSTKREGFSAIPDVKWEDVGALCSVQRDLEFYISRRIRRPEDYQALGLDMNTGFLLFGPPGCGKTLVAKAVANDAQANFIYIKGPELLNKYVGESEHAVRALFSRAASCAPCILFFDEIDALAPRRGTDGNAVAERVLNQLLSEMDGAEKRKGVFLIAATNRPDMIDPAMLRPGRLGKLLYVPLPSAEGRLSILTTLTRQKPLSVDVSLASIAINESCEGLSGADLAALVNEACVAALQERITNINSASQVERVEPLVVCNRHFSLALSQISPSVSKQDLMYYEDLPQKFHSRPGMKGIASENFF